MVYNYYPNRINLYEQSYDPKLFLTTKVVSAIAISCLLFPYLVYEIPTFFVYLTNWGIILTFTYFFLSILNYVYSSLDKVVFSLYHIVWGFDWVITLAYWGYLYHASPPLDLFRGCIIHSLPIITTLIDFGISRIILVRSQYLFVLGTLGLYFFGILIPYTVIRAPVYAGINFHNSLSYIFPIGLVVVSIIMLEFARFIGIYLKSHSENNSNQYQHDLTVGLVN
jgi:hypothetical protein